MDILAALPGPLSLGGKFRQRRNCFFRRTVGLRLRLADVRCRDTAFANGKTSSSLSVKVIHSPATLAADEAASRVARNHRTSVTIRLQEDATASDHVVALTAGGATASSWNSWHRPNTSTSPRVPLQVKTKGISLRKEKVLRASR